MFKEGLFTFSIILSLAAHTAVFCVFGYLPQDKKIHNLNTPLEISYEGKRVKVEETNMVKIPTEETPPVKLFNDNGSLKNFIKEEVFKKRDELDIIKEPLEKKIKEPAKKSVSMPSIPGQTFKTPEYKDYYWLIREKIRRYAYFNYKKLFEGDVTLSFTLDPRGNIMNLSVDSEKSTHQSYLQQIAVKSVKDASPFPPFPKKLNDQKELSFNVIISFELK